MTDFSKIGKQNWIKRKKKFGKSGYSKEGLERMKASVSKRLSGKTSWQFGLRKGNVSIDKIWHKRRELYGRTGCSKQGRKNINAAMDRKKFWITRKKKYGDSGLSPKGLEIVRDSMRRTAKMLCGEKHYAWIKTWNDMSYSIKHLRMLKNIVKPQNCVLCHNSKQKLQLSNKDHKYSDNISDWQWVCSSCHIKFDYKNNRKIKSGGMSYEKTKNYLHDDNCFGGSGNGVACRLQGAD